MKIGKIAIGAEYRMDEQYQNLLIFRYLIIFQIKKKIFKKKIPITFNFKN